MHCIQVTLSSRFILMWHFAPVVGVLDLALLLPSSVTRTDGHCAPVVGMQDLALLMPSVATLTDGYIPPFALDLSAAGMHNTTAVVSDVTDGLPNGTVRCQGCKHLHWNLHPPLYNAQRPACIWFQTANSVGFVQVYDQLQQYRALNNNERHVPRHFCLIILIEQ